MNKKKITPIVLVVCVFILILLAFFLSDRKLDLLNKEITTLYQYLGEVDIYHCGGLYTYSDKSVTKNILSSDNTLCMAYYNIDNSKLIEKTIKSDNINKNKVKTCLVGESTTLAASDETNLCTYITITKSDLNKAYNDIYGEDIKKHEKFYISSNEACYLEGDIYYCGTAETFAYSLTPEATIYRLQKKAIQKLNDDIIIYDYFLKISGNKCYQSNNTEEENSACSKKLSDLTNEEIDKLINKDFIKKYGTIYKHTFKKNKHNDYYWYSSQKK